MGLQANFFNTNATIPKTMIIQKYCSYIRSYQFHIQNLLFQTKFISKRNSTSGNPEVLFQCFATQKEPMHKQLRQKRKPLQSVLPKQSCWNGYLRWPRADGQWLPWHWNTYTADSITGTNCGKCGCKCRTQFTITGADRILVAIRLK
jgi:hypothetical protein